MYMLSYPLYLPELAVLERDVEIAKSQDADRAQPA
jgi:hypothetical protein